MRCCLRQRSALTADMVVPGLSFQVQSIEEATLENAGLGWDVEVILAYTKQNKIKVRYMHSVDKKGKLLDNARKAAENEK